MNFFQESIKDDFRNKLRGRFNLSDLVRGNVASVVRYEVNVKIDDYVWYGSRMHVFRTVYEKFDEIVQSQNV